MHGSMNIKKKYSKKYMSNRYCYLLASGNEMEHNVVPTSKQVAVSV